MSTSAIEAPSGARDPPAAAGVGPEARGLTLRVQMHTPLVCQLTSHVDLHGMFIL